MALKDQIRKRIAAPPTDPPEERRNSGTTNGTFQTNNGYQNGFERRRKRRKSISDRRSSLFISIAVVMIGTVLSLVLITIMTRIFSSSSSSIGGGGECIESLINGVPRNIYTWCYKNQSRRRLGRDILSLGSSGLVERIVRDKSGKDVAKNPKELIAVISSHDHLMMNEIVAEDQDELCYADFSKPNTIEMTPTIAVRPVVGPCNYEYPKFTAPREGYEGGIDYYFFRDVDQTKFSDELKCFNECLDRVLVDPDQLTKSKNGERSMSELQPNDKVAVDNIMLIEAARDGLTLTVEKLMVKYNLDPLYRQVRNDPGNGRSLNAIQEALRGGYAEIVKVLTNGDSSIIIDDYGRSVEDYIKMKGSPISAYDAKHVLGIEVAEESGSRQQQRGTTHMDSKGSKKSGWNQTTANPINDYCDFDVVDGDLSAEIFYRDYFIPGRPVSLRGQASEMELSMFSKKSWKRTEKFHPDELFKVGPQAYPSLTGQESCSEEMSIRDMENGAVCEEMPEKPMLHALHPESSDFEELYPAYDGNILDSRGGFRTIKKWFPFATKESDLTWQVFFGGDRSGATYH